MIVLDTNVMSEAMRPEPSSAVRKWLNDQVAETLYLSSVPLAELLYEIGSLPEGRRKHGLAAVFDGVVQLFGERVLPFDADAAPATTQHWRSRHGVQARGYPRRTGISRRLRPRGTFPLPPVTPALSRRQEIPSSTLGITPDSSGLTNDVRTSLISSGR